MVHSALGALETAATNAITRGSSKSTIHNLLVPPPFVPTLTILGGRSHCCLICAP